MSPYIKLSTSLAVCLCMTLGSLTDLSMALKDHNVQNSNSSATAGVVRGKIMMIFISGIRISNNIFMYYFYESVFTSIML